MGDNKSPHELTYFDPAHNHNLYFHQFKRVMLGVVIFMIVAYFVNTTFSLLGTQKTEVTSFV